MPVCPNCEYEYVEGVTYCPDCGVSLVSDDVYVKPEEWDEENWDVVYITGDELEAEMIKNNLSGAGIEAVVLSQKDRNFPGAGDLSVVKLMVKKSDLGAAISYIQTSKSGPEPEE